MLRRDSLYFRYVNTESSQARRADKNQQRLRRLSRFSQVFNAAANQLATGKLVRNRSTPYQSIRYHPKINLARSGRSSILRPSSVPVFDSKLT